MKERGNKNHIVHYNHQQFVCLISSSKDDFYIAFSIYLHNVSGQSSLTLVPEPRSHEFHIYGIGLITHYTHANIFPP